MSWWILGGLVWLFFGFCGWAIVHGANLSKREHDVDDRRDIRRR